MFPRLAEVTSMSEIGDVFRGLENGRAHAG
jgi:hypothetical protein